MELSGREVTALYILLSKYDNEQHPVIVSLFERLQRYMFEKCTIEELENIESIFKSGIDVTDKRS